MTDLWLGAGGGGGRFLGDSCLLTFDGALVTVGNQLVLTVFVGITASSRCQGGNRWKPGLVMVQNQLFAMIVGLYFSMNVVCGKAAGMI